MTKEESQPTETLTVEVTEEETTLTDESTENSESSEDESTESESENTEDESPTSKDDDETEEDEEDDGIKRIRKLNGENKSLRTRLREAEDQLKTLGTDPDALKTLISERDNYKTQYDNLITSLRTERLTNVMTDVSRKAGAIEPSAVIALAAASDVAVEYDAENKPTNVDAVVKNLKTKFPKLFGTSSFNGNAGSRDDRDADLDSLTPEQRMKQGFEKP